MKITIRLKDDAPLPLVFRFLEPLSSEEFDDFCQRNLGFIVETTDDGSIRMTPKPETLAKMRADKDEPPTPAYEF